MPIFSQTAAQTIENVIVRRPVLTPVLRAFEPLLTAQAQLASELADAVALSGPDLTEPSVERIRQGVSLLTGKPLTGTAGPLRTSAEKLLPLMHAMDTLTAHMPALTAFFLKPIAHSSERGVERADSREALAEAVVSGECKAVAGIAEANGMEAPVFAFVSGFVVSPVLRALAVQARLGKGTAPWDKDGLWRQGYCPVCGALPSISWLDKPFLDEKNAYLVGGGGKKHFYCGQCGTDWHFRRGACPSCEQEGSGVMEILREKDFSHGEKLEWCTKCRTYCPSVDLREREYMPDLDAAAIGMMHLDMVAMRKELRPLRASFWNMF